MREKANRQKRSQVVGGERDEGNFIPKWGGSPRSCELLGEAARNFSEKLIGPRNLYD